MIGEVWASFSRRRRMRETLTTIARACGVALTITAVDQGWITTRIKFEVDGPRERLIAFRDVCLGAFTR